MKRLLHLFSITGTYMMFFGAIFMVLELIFGFIPFVRGMVIFGFPIAEPIFFVVTYFLIRKYVHISSPYKEKTS